MFTLRTFGNTLLRRRVHCRTTHSLSTVVHSFEDMPYATVFTMQEPHPRTVSIEEEGLFVANCAVITTNLFVVTKSVKKGEELVLHDERPVGSNVFAPSTCLNEF